MMSEIVTGVMRKTAKKRSSVRVCVPIYMCVCVCSLVEGRFRALARFCLLPAYLYSAFRFTWQLCICACVCVYIHMCIVGGKQR